MTGDVQVKNHFDHGHHDNLRPSKKNQPIGNLLDNLFVYKNNLYQITMYGAKITSIRVARGFTQIYMSKQLGITQNIYSNIETGKGRPDEEMLEKIAGILSVSLADIKSHTPIIMNFAEEGRSVLMNELLNQIKLKDRQIEEKDRLIAELVGKI